MYLAVGSYTFATGSVHIATRETAEFSSTGRPVTKTRTFTCRGTLTAASQSAMKTAIDAFEAALAIHNQDVILYQDDASESATVLKAATSLTGVQLIEGPTYPTTEGGENATHRTWEATWQAVYPVANVSDNFALTFTESLTISGGGARWIHKPNILGVWQKQLVYPKTPYVAVQQGQATGLRAYPVIPPPIFPQALVDEYPEVSRTGPQQQGLLLRDYGVSWSYRFESVSPLVGLPSVWRNP